MLYLKFQYLVVSTVSAPACPCHPGRLHEGRVEAAEGRNLLTVGHHGFPKQPRIRVLEEGVNKKCVLGHESRPTKNIRK